MEAQLHPTKKEPVGLLLKFLSQKNLYAFNWESWSLENKLAGEKPDSRNICEKERRIEKE